MKIAIVGTGPAGGTLYRLLNSRHKVDLFSKEPETKCGCKPCAWGVNTCTFEAFCKYLGVDARGYCIRQFSEASVQGIRAKAMISLIDKPKFIRDLIGGSVKYGEPDLGEYDRVIDATGKRAYLNNAQEGRQHQTFQIRVSMTLKDMGLRVWLNPEMPSQILWLFPLSWKEAHIGILGLAGSPSYGDLMNGLAMCGLAGQIDRIECSCVGAVWAGGFRTPFAEGNVFGIGESIGLVDPISGSGILPAMASARLLYEHWDNPVGYCEAIRRRFGYIDSGARIIGALESGGKPNWQDVLAYSSERCMRGISLSLALLVKLLAKNYKVSRGLAQALAR